MATISSGDSKTQLYFDSTTTYTLPVPADFVNTVGVVKNGATSFAVTLFTVTDGTAGAGTVHFAGSPGNPSTDLTFETAPTAGSLIMVEYIPAGTL